ncbi:MAG: hypothetical protein MOB07_16655 [Acidobacteria bacterium]|nr:hypothetical protein [Acidobacteriota bacterium]
MESRREYLAFSIVSGNERVSIKDRLMETRSLPLTILIFVCLLFSGIPVRAQNKSQPKDARAAVQTFFSLLKSQQYSSLYDFLPGQLQQQFTSEQLAQSLKRLDSFIVIERMEIGRIQQKGDFAVIDTTIYGRLKKPIKLSGEEVNEGRTSVQQYLFKENGQWKVATADSRTRDYFLRQYPEFNKQFQFMQPRFEFKQNGRWTSFEEGIRNKRK